MSRNPQAESRAETRDTLRRGKTVRVRMSDELIERLRRCSRAYGVSVAQIVRLAIKHTLNEGR